MMNADTQTFNQAIRVGAIYVKKEGDPPEHQKARKVLGIRLRKGDGWVVQLIKFTWPNDPAWQNRTCTLTKRAFLRDTPIQAISQK